MYDIEIILDLLDKMIEATDRIINRTKNINSSDDFLSCEENLIILDSVCMQLIAIGEAVKEIDKLTEKSLLRNYRNIEWKRVAGMRDILAHHYFDLNAEIVYDALEYHIKTLRETLILIREKVLKGAK